MNQNELFPGMDPGPEGIPFPGYDGDESVSESAPGMPFGSMSEEKAPAGPWDENVDIDDLYDHSRTPVSRPIRILTGVIGDGNGGMSTYAVNLFKALPESLVSVTFLSTSEHPFFEKEIKDHYGRIKVIPSRRRHPFAHKKAIRKIMEE